jgi:hypothetical protein
MEQVENIFKNLPKSMKWRSFYENDLQILMDTSEMRKGRLKTVRLKAVRFFEVISSDHQHLTSFVFRTVEKSFALFADFHGTAKLLCDAA